MRRSKIIKIVLATVLLLSLGLLILEVKEKKRVASFKAENNKPSSFTNPLEIVGYNCKVYNGSNLILEAKADEFKVNPRKFAIFNVLSFNELTITNANLKLYSYEGIDTGMDPFSFYKNTLPTNDKEKAEIVSKELGFVTRGVINGLVLEIYRSGEICLVVKAKKVYLDFSAKEARLVDVIISEVLQKRRIESSLAIWDGKKNVLNLPENYIIFSPKGKKAGKGKTIAIDKLVHNLR